MYAGRARLLERARLSRLGQLDDTIADDFDAESANDPRADWLAWSAAVKRYGGYVAQFPVHQQGTLPLVNAPQTYAEASSGSRTDDVYGAPAAAYPVNVIYPPPGYDLNPIFHRPPDAWSNDSSVGYYLAPLAAMRYTVSGQSVKPQQVPGEPAPPKPNWYDELVRSAKYIGIGLAVIAALDVASFLPRSRS